MSGMSKLSSVVASVTQQSRQRVPQSQTEYREGPTPYVTNNGST